MSNLQKVLEKSKIDFSKPLNPNQVEDLFEFLANNSIEINYQIEIRGSINLNDPKKLFKQKYVSKISGSMTDISVKTGLSFSTFECFMESKSSGKEDDPMSFYGFKFFNIPGYDLEQYRKEEIQLWDKVRKLTQEYFSR